MICHLTKFYKTKLAEYQVFIHNLKVILVSNS